MTATTVRPAEPRDLAPVLALLERSGLPTVGVASTFDGFLVAEAAGDIVGAIGIERCGAYGLLRSAAVDDGWRGRGVGRQLVARALAGAEVVGYRALYLLTTTAEGYFPAFGFAVVDRASVPEEIRATDEFRDACPASATVMARTVGTR